MTFNWDGGGRLDSTFDDGFDGASAFAGLGAGFAFEGGLLGASGLAGGGSRADGISSSFYIQRTDSSLDPVREHRQKNIR